MTGRSKPVKGQGGKGIDWRGKQWTVGSCILRQPRRSGISSEKIEY